MDKISDQPDKKTVFFYNLLLDFNMAKWTKERRHLPLNY